MSQDTLMNDIRDEVARSLIRQHMDDCGKRYGELRNDIAARFSVVEVNRDQRHLENVQRLNAQDRTLANINRMVVAALGTLLVGAASVIVMLIHNGGHL